MTLHRTTARVIIIGLFDWSWRYKVTSPWSIALKTTFRAQTLSKFCNRFRVEAQFPMNMPTTKGSASCLPRNFDQKAFAHLLSGRRWSIKASALPDTIQSTPGWTIPLNQRGTTPRLLKPKTRIDQCQLMSLLCDRSYEFDNPQCIPCFRNRIAEAIQHTLSQHCQYIYIYI